MLHVSWQFPFDSTGKQTCSAFIDISTQSMCVVYSTTWMWPRASVYFLLPGAIRKNTFNYTYYLIVNMCGGGDGGDTCMLQGKRACKKMAWGRWFSIFVTWVLRTDFRSSGLLASAFICLPTLSSQEEILVKLSSKHDLILQNLREVWALWNIKNILSF